MRSKSDGNEAAEKVERAMHEMKRGRLMSGRSGRRVTDPKQAIAIGLSEARASTAKKSTAKKSTAKKSTAKKSTAKKSTAKKSTAKKSTAPALAREVMGKKPRAAWPRPRTSAARASKSRKLELTPDNPMNGAIREAEGDNLGEGVDVARTRASDFEETDRSNSSTNDDHAYEARFGSGLKRGDRRSKDAQATSDIANGAHEQRGIRSEGAESLVNDVTPSPEQQSPPGLGAR